MALWERGQYWDSCLKHLSTGSASPQEQQVGSKQDVICKPASVISLLTFLCEAVQPELPAGATNGTAPLVNGTTSLFTS